MGTLLILGKVTLMGRSIKLSSVCVLAAALVLGGPPAAWATVTGQWFFSEVVIDAGTPIGNQIPNGQQFQSGTLPAIHAANDAAGTTVRAANLDAGHLESVYFPGWTLADGAGQVPPNTSMLSSDPGFEALNGTTDGVDAGTAFDPGTASSFKVSAWVKPDDPALFPAAVGQGTSVSPNIVQKGVQQAAASQHFWKMSLAMTNTTPRRWFAFCLFKGEYVGATGTAVTVKPGWSTSASGQLQLTPGLAYKVECTKTATAATVTVTPAGGSAASKTLALSAALNVSNNRPLSVGKKPASVDARDVYAGILDNLVVDKTP